MKTLFTSKLDLNLRKKPVKHYVWGMALYGAKTWTFRIVEQKHLESFEIWCRKRIEEINPTEYVEYQEVLLQRIKDERNKYNTGKEV
jgi:hypothetical protein